MACSTRGLSQLEVLRAEPEKNCSLRVWTGASQALNGKGMLALLPRSPQRNMGNLIV